MRSRAERRRGGGVLVEFALVALVFSFFLGGVLDLGSALFSSQQLQRAAQVAAREIALLPLPAAGLSLNDALTCRRSQLSDPAFAGCASLAGLAAIPRETVYDPDWLVIPCGAQYQGSTFDCVAADPAGREAFVSRLPLLNRMLRPLMVWDRLPSCTAGVNACRLLRYPGALVRDAGSVTSFRVVIPRLAGSTVTCVEAVQPITTPADPFPLAAGGLVSLRIVYPFQGAGRIAARSGSGGTRSPVLVDATLSCVGLTTVTTAGFGGAQGVGSHAGPLGLGRLFAYGEAVRPFRRVLVAEGLFRREVFQ